MKIIAPLSDYPAILAFDRGFMTLCRARILALAAAGAFLTSHSRALAQPVTGWSPIPTLENVQTDLLHVLSKAHLDHAQHEQVERIIANETFQLALARGNENFSVAQVFSREQVIRLQARREIEALLTPRQKLRIAKYVVHEMEEQEQWGHDRTHFFSIPATY